MLASLLDREIYSYADVDRLVGVHAGTTRRWLEGYDRSGRFYEPVLRPEPTGSEAVTWGEMVEARLLADFRRRSVPVQRMRPAIVALRKEFGRYPLAVARPFLDVDGRALVRTVQDEVGLDHGLRLVVVRNGQLILSPTAERFQSLVEYQEGSAARVRPDPRTPGVVMTRRAPSVNRRSATSAPKRWPKTSAPGPAGLTSPTCTTSLSTRSTRRSGSS
jgi:hypothetical protein